MTTTDSPTGQAVRPDTTAGRLAELTRRRAAAREPGSPRALAARRADGKLTARDRVDLLLDPGSFVELGELARRPGAGSEAERPFGDGVVTGHGTVDGRRVCVFSHDATVFGGSLGEVFGRKVAGVMDLAIRTGCPIVGINDSGGARIQEGVAALAHYAEIGLRNVRASGVVPQISLITGPCAGGAVYSPAITDFTVVVDGSSQMFVTGPDVLRQVTGEEISMEDLGGARTVATGGNAQHLAADDAEAVDWVRDLLSFLPSHQGVAPPVLPHQGVTGPDPELDVLIPDSSRAGYDMAEVIARVVDDGDLLEVSPLFARNVLCGFARVEGAPVGVVANQPLHLSGALDIDGSEKAARFVRFCDAFGLPLLTFADIPGYLPGLEQERGGIIRRGAKLIFAYAEATVPKVTVITRKAYGGGYAVMGSKHLGADVNLAWPTARIAVMGASGAVSLLHRRELAAAGEDAPALRSKLIAEYEATVATPYQATDRGYVDAVIPPSATRTTIASALRALRGKQQDVPARKHNTMPL
ncbi:MAG: acyl-CoA carboxylase subunit beta [Pseudonocardiaceae bacterium]